MRQGQQNRRGRSRGRKSQNPLTRNYESNGPDVRIRGTASHIADKYGALARDALSSGDPITAENYFQHAEHYNRIIMAAQAQAQPGAPQPAVVNGAAGGGLVEPESETRPAEKKVAEEEPRPKKRRRRSTANGSSRRASSSETAAEAHEHLTNGSGATNGVDASADSPDKEKAVSETEGPAN